MEKITLNRIKHQLSMEMSLQIMMRLIIQDIRRSIAEFDKLMDQYLSITNKRSGPR